MIPKALVVEDSADFRTLICLILERLGFDGLADESAEGALDRLDGGYLPAVIITDFDLGVGMDGGDFLREVRRRPTLSAVPVILTSNHPSIQQMAVELAFDGFVEKKSILSNLPQLLRALVLCHASFPGWGGELAPKTRR